MLAGAVGVAAFAPAAAFAETATDTSEVSAVLDACQSSGATVEVGTIGLLTLAANPVQQDGGIAYEGFSFLGIDTGENAGLAPHCEPREATLSYSYTAFTNGTDTATTSTTVSTTTHSTGATSTGSDTLIGSYTGTLEEGLTWTTVFPGNTPPGTYTSTATFTLTF